MRIVTWNVNGLRSFKTPLKKLFDDLKCEIICLQETKVSRENLDEQTAIVEGYNSYFSFSKVRSGYSGVATFVKNECTPWLAEDGLSEVGKKETDDIVHVGCYGDSGGLSIEEQTSIDDEGRSVMTEHEIMDAAGDIRRLVVINVYCPRAEPDNEERVRFKLQFYKLLQTRAEEIFKSGRSVVVVGDINTCHKAIDHCDPAEEVEFESNPGRRWMNSFVFDHDRPPNVTSDDLGVEGEGRFVDALRMFHPRTPGLFTNWCATTGARATNYGSRLDYIFADKKLALADKMLTDCRICPEVAGSDHCPVVAELSCVVLSAPKCPPICTKFMLKFKGTQQKLSGFFSSKENIPDKNVKEIFYGDENQSRNLSGDSQSLLGKHSAPTSQKVPSKKIKKDTNKITCYFSQFKKEEDSFVGTTEVGEREGSELPASWPLLGSSEAASRQSWVGVLGTGPEVVLCKGHGERCVLRTVKKPGPNKGRQFWVCNRPEGHKSNLDARCDCFVWVDKK